MAGLTSSVASALSELSLSDVDLGSSVHSDVTPRQLPAHGHPSGECSKGRKKGRGLGTVMSRVCGRPPVMPGGPLWVTWFPREAGDTMGKAWVPESSELG